MQNIFALVLGAILIGPLVGCEIDEDQHRGDYDRDHHGWRHEEYRGDRDRDFDRHHNDWRRD